MSRFLAILFALALGLGGTYAAHHYGLISFSDSETPEGRPMPAPTGGASGTPTGATSPAPDELGPATLVPEGAFLYVEVASLSAIENLVRNLVARVEPGMAGSVNADMLVGQMLAMIGGDATQLDKHRPFGMALSPPAVGMQQPVATLVLPVRDPSTFVRSLQVPPGFAEPETRRQYVGITMGPEYRLVPDGAPAFASDLPQTTFAMRVQMEPIRPMLAPAMEQSRAQAEMAAQMAGVNADAYMAGYELGMGFVEAIEQLELGIGAKGSELEIVYAVDVDEESDWTLQSPAGEGRLHELAGYAQEDDTLSCLFSWDQEFLDRMVTPVLESVEGLAQNDEERAVFEALRAVLAAAPTFGQEIAFSGRLAVGETRALLVCRPESPDAFVEALPLTLAGLGLDRFGVAVSPLEREEGEGLAYHLTLGVGETSDDPATARVQQAVALCFGTRAIDVRLVSKDGVLALLVGGDAAWQAEHVATLGTPGRGASDVAQAFERVLGDSISAVYRIDMNGLMRGVLALAAEHMELDPSAELEQLAQAVGTEPMPITVYSAADGSRWRGGIRMDWERLFRLMEATGGGGF